MINKGIFFNGLEGKSMEDLDEGQSSVLIQLKLD